MPINKEKSSPSTIRLSHVQALIRRVMRKALVPRNYKNYLLVSTISNFADFKYASSQELEEDVNTILSQLPDFPEEMTADDTYHTIADVEALLPGHIFTDQGIPLSSRKLLISTIVAMHVIEISTRHAIAKVTAEKVATIDVVPVFKLSSVDLTLSERLPEQSHRGPLITITEPDKVPPNNNIHSLAPTSLDSLPSGHFTTKRRRNLLAATLGAAAATVLAFELNNTSSSRAPQTTSQSSVHAPEHPQSIVPETTQPSSHIEPTNQVDTPRLINANGRMQDPYRADRTLFEIGVKSALLTVRQQVEQCWPRSDTRPNSVNWLSRQIVHTLNTRHWHVGDPTIPAGITLAWPENNCHNITVMQWQQPTPLNRITINTTTVTID